MLALTLALPLAQTLALTPVAATAASDGSSAWMAAGFILLAVGVAIALAELFIPSGGLLGACAATALVASVVCFFVYDQAWGFGALVLYLAGSPIAILVGLKLWTHSPIAKRMVLGGITDQDDDAAQQERERHEPTRIGVGAPGSKIPVQALVGQSAVAVTTMRPVGVVRLGMERIEAHAESGMIEAGTKVTVVACDGARVVVRAVAE